MMFINYIFEYMQESNTIESKQVKITEKTIHNIRFENVSFKYIGGDYYALKDINISFNTTVVIDDSVPERFLIRVVLYGEKE